MKEKKVASLKIVFEDGKNYTITELCLEYCGEEEE